MRSRRKGALRTAGAAPATPARRRAPRRRRPPSSADRRRSVEARRLGIAEEAARRASGPRAQRGTRSARASFRRRRARARRVAVRAAACSGRARASRRRCAPSRASRARCRGSSGGLRASRRSRSPRSETLPAAVRIARRRVGELRLLDRRSRGCVVVARSCTSRRSNEPFSSWSPLTKRSTERERRVHGAERLRDALLELGQAVQDVGRGVVDALQRRRRRRHVVPRRLERQRRRRIAHRVEEVGLEEAHAGDAGRHELHAQQRVR